MEFEGTVYKILPVTKGTSARGEWQRQDVVFEMNEGSFTRKICVTFFNKPEDVARLKEGSTYNVSVNIESREYNGRWYTDIRAWRLQPKQEAAAAPMPDMPPIAEEPSYASAKVGFILACQGAFGPVVAVIRCHRLHRHSRGRPGRSGPCRRPGRRRTGLRRIPP